MTKFISAIVITKSIRRQSSARYRPIMPIPALVIRIAIEGIIGDEALIKGVYK
jgi:hypothetical protein